MSTNANHLIMLGRVSTSYKAGIPAHVLSILNCLSGSELTISNLVPSLKVPVKLTQLFSSNTVKINNSCVEIECASIFVHKTFAVSISFFLRLIHLISTNPSAPIHIHLPDPISIFAVILCKKRRIIATYHADLLGKGFFTQVYNVLLDLLFRKRNVVFVVPTPFHVSTTRLSRYSKNPVLLPFIFMKPNITPLNIKLLQRKFDNTVTNFLFVGRQVAYKGIDVSLQAFRLIPNDLKCTYTVVGDGPLAAYNKSLSKDDPRINYTGEISNEELSSLYLSSHIFILPSISRAEAFGIVQVEAMLSYCFCLTSYLGNGVNYVNKNGISGYNFPVGDFTALSKLMIQFAGSISSRNMLMNSAREYALSTFASTDLHESYLSLYTK